MTKPAPRVMGEPDPNAGDRAELDDDGLLWYQGRWVDIPRAQLRVFAVLVARQNELVRTAELIEAHMRDGGATTPGAIRQLIYRIRHRVAGLGVDVHVVRGRGVVFDTTSSLGDRLGA